MKITLKLILFFICVTFSINSYSQTKFLIGDSLWGTPLYAGPGDKVIKLHDNNLLISGVFFGQTQIIKTTISGNIIWNKIITTSPEDNYVNEILETNDNNIMLAGSTGNNIRNIFFAKLDSSGNIIWSEDIGGPDDEFVSSLVELSDSSFIGTGTFNNGFNGDDDMLLIKIDKNGVHQWSRYYGSSDGESGDKIVKLTENEIIVGGTSNSVLNGQPNLYFTKVDSTGSMIDSRAAGISGNYMSVLSDFIVTDNDDIVVAGWTTGFSGFSDIEVIRLDSQFNVLWSKIIIDSLAEFCNSLFETNQGNIVCAGYQNELIQNAVLFEMSASGNLNWYSSFLDTALTLNTSVESGNKTVAIGTMKDASNRSFIYFNEIDSSGNGCEIFQTAPLINNLILDTATVFWGSHTLSYATNPMGADSTRVCKKTDICGSINSLPYIQNEYLNVFPNPVEDFLKIKLTSLDQFTYKITDVSGKIITSGHVSTNENEIIIDLNNLTKGIYFIIASDGRRDFQNKFIKL